MLVRLLSLLLLTLVAAFGAPSAASAKPLVGISDNRPMMFADPNFTSLGVKQVRIVVSYNMVAAAARGDNELSDKVAPYIALAQAQGIDVLIAFEHARGDPHDCNSGTGDQCRLPSVAAYKSQIKKFLAQFPTIRQISPWNEVNHNTQPTYKNPRRAAQFTKAAEQVCRELRRRCTIVAMDLLDAANDPTLPTRKLNFSRTIRYIKTMRRAYGRTPAVCGIHNYADVNRFRTAGTKALTRAMRCKRYWLTETGGFYNFASFWSKSTKKAGKCRTAATCQVKALRYLFSKTLRASRKIDRVYIYNWFSGDDGQFDAGLVKGDGTSPKTKKRPAFNIVAGRI